MRGEDYPRPPMFYNISSCVCSYVWNKQKHPSTNITRVIVFKHLHAFRRAYRLFVAFNLTKQRMLWGFFSLFHGSQIWLGHFHGGSRAVVEHLLLSIKLGVKARAIPIVRRGICFERSSAKVLKAKRFHKCRNSAKRTPNGSVNT